MLYQHVPSWSPLSLTSFPAASTTSQISVSSLHPSSAALASVSHSSLSAHRHSRIPSYSTLPHPHFTRHHPHPSTTDHSPRPPPSSFYPVTSAPSTVLSNSSSSTTSMIVSALSFYDPAHASAVPDYHDNRWDGPFDPSLPGSVGDSLASRDSSFLSGPASTSGNDFRLVHSATTFDLHRGNAPSEGSQSRPQQPSQSQQQHRQVTPAPRRQRDLLHYDASETQAHVQTSTLLSVHRPLEQPGQRKAESQVKPSLTLSVPNLMRAFFIVFRIKMLHPKILRTNDCKSYFRYHLIRILHLGNHILYLTSHRLSHGNLQPPFLHHMTNQAHPTCIHPL